MNRKIAERKVIDREKTCPFLLRLFWKENDAHSLEDFIEKGKEPVQDEVQVYTWKDATLRELVDLVKSSIPCAMRKEAKFKFTHIYQDLSGKLKKKELATLHSIKKSKDCLLYTSPSPRDGLLSRMPSSA
eukprot:TRINITY_DN5154_c0_g1_i6.p1 TRINITY_DN5154_c0_g1~~TRINITY_DN5154_c0_g1_i6.p1  ORF type:complete len:130 (-),score=25.67 TRINITY_DN5154_c0_g1_i6:38-427(-)